MKVLAKIVAVFSLATLVIASLWLMSVRASVWVNGPSWHQGPLTDTDMQGPVLQAVDKYLIEHSRYHEGLQDGMRRYDKAVVTVVTWADGDVNVFIANAGPQLLGGDGLPWPGPDPWTPVLHGPRFFQGPHPVLMFAMHPDAGRYLFVNVAQGDSEKPVAYTDEGVIARIEIFRMALPEPPAPAVPKATEPGVRVMSFPSQ